MPNTDVVNGRSSSLKFSLHRSHPTALPYVLMWIQPHFNQLNNPFCPNVLGCPLDPLSSHYLVLSLEVSGVC